MNLNEPKSNSLIYNGAILVCKKTYKYHYNICSFLTAVEFIYKTIKSQCYDK